MWKYIKAAFAVKQHIPLLGSIPINAIILPIIACLTIIHPAFLLIGIGFEAALIYSLSSSPRFRQLVDSPKIQEIQRQQEDRRTELINKLNEPNRQQFLKLEKRIAQTQASYHEFDSPDYISEPNLKSLNSLAWIYLKLIFAKAALTGSEGDQNAIHLEQQIQNLKNELNNKQVSNSVRKSKEATLEILDKRLKHFVKRNDTIEEINADITRIEAQVELARDNARLHAKPEAISMDVDLASDTLQSVWFYGEADDTIHSLNEQYSEQSPLAQ